LGNAGGYRPLHLAAARGHRWLVDNLLRRGADADLCDLSGFRPEDCARVRGPALSTFPLKLILNRSWIG